MPQFRRLTWAVLVLLVAASACRKKEEGPEGARPGEGAAVAGKIETEAVAGDLPAGAGVVVSLYEPRQYWTRLKSTQLWTQLLAIPELQRVMDPNQNPQLGQAFAEFEAKFGMPLNEQTIFGLLGKKVQIGLYSGAETGADSLATQRLVMVADAADRDALGSLLQGLRKDAEGKGGKFAAEKYKDVDVTVASGADGTVRGLYGFHKEKLVAATDQGGFQDAVNALDGEGATMDADSLYQRALAHVGEASITVFVSKAATKGLMGAMERASAAAGRAPPAGAPQADRMAEVVDRYNVQSAVVLGSNWTEGGLEARSYTMLDPAAPGAAPLREMLTTKPSEIEVVGYFPDSTLAFYSVNFLDAVKIYDFAVAYIKDVASAADTAAGADSTARVDQAIAQFQQRTGLDIRADILGWMGREAAFGLNGVVKGGFFPVPEFSLVVQAADPARAQTFFQKLETQIAATAQSAPQLQGFPVQFQEEEYKGVKIRFAPTPMGEGLAPAYALQEDYAIVALSPGTLKRMLDAKTGAVPNVSGNAQFKTLSGFFPGQANIVGYANTMVLFTEIGAAISTFQQMSGQTASAETQDSMTRVIAALKNIQAAGTYGLNDAGGVEQRYLIKIQ